MAKHAGFDDTAHGHNMRNVADEALVVIERLSHLYLEADQVAESILGPRP